MVHITDAYGKEHAITEMEHELIKKVLDFLRYSEKSSMTTQNFINEFQAEFEKVNVGRFGVYGRFGTLYSKHMASDVLYMKYRQRGSVDEKGYIMIPIFKDKNDYVQFEDLFIGITDMKVRNDKSNIDEFLIRVHENKEFVESVEYITELINKYNKHTEESTSESTKGDSCEEDSWGAIVVIIIFILFFFVLGICAR